MLHLITCHGRIMPRLAELLFIFCINVDIDELLLIDKNKGLGINSFRVISLYNSWKGVLVFAFILHILLNNFRNFSYFA